MAVLNLNPTNDFRANFLRSVGTKNWELVDEGFSRPNTADYTYILDAVTNDVDEIYKFTATDNFEIITQIKLRAYLARALLSTIIYKFVIEDAVGNRWMSSNPIIPPSGIFSEQNETLISDPLAGGTWIYGNYKDYNFGIVAVDGSDDVLQLATFALEVTTQPGGIKMVREGLVNIR